MTGEVGVERISGPVGVGFAAPEASQPLTVSQPQGMRSVPLVALLPGTPIPFPLHLGIGSSTVFYHDQGDRLEGTDLDDLVARGVSEMWIPGEAVGRFHRYFLEHLDRLLGPPGAPIDGPTLFANSIIATECIFADLHAPSTGSRVARVVEGALALAGCGSDLLAVVESGADPLCPFAAHGYRVCLHGLLLAVGTGLDDRELLLDLGIGLLLHDLDKVSGAGGGGDVERGAALAKGLDWLGEVAVEVIGLYHEGHDGRGRSRLAGRPLPLTVRIAAVADGFDHRTFDDQGRTLAGADDALREMIASDHGAFDPRLLALMIRSIAL